MTHTITYSKIAIGTCHTESSVRAEGVSVEMTDDDMQSLFVTTNDHPASQQCGVCIIIIIFRGRSRLKK